MFDNRKDEDSEYWLKMIETFGGDSPVLVVINKIDEHPDFDVNRSLLACVSVLMASDRGTKKRNES